MKNQIVAMLLLFSLSVASSSLQAATRKTEDELIKEFQESNPTRVSVALGHLEDKYPNRPKSVAAIKTLLRDPRPAVRRKAARVLGVVHADVSENDIKAICELLKAADPDEVDDGLKALRGLRASSAVPVVLTTLTNEDTYVLRDACRTLAVIGNKDAIASLEHLLRHSDLEVREEAEAAIGTIRARP